MENMENPMPPANDMPPANSAPENKSGSAVAVVALVFGIIAILFGIIPFVGILALVPAIVAVVCGIVAMKGVRRGMGIAGLVLGIVTMVIVIGSTVACAGLLSNSNVQVAVNEAVEEYNESFDVTIDKLDVKEKGTVAVVTYTFTNKGDDEASPWVSCNFDASQGKASLDRNYKISCDDEGFMEEVESGKSVTFQVAYDLKNKKDVTVEVSQLINLSGDGTIATKTFAVK